MALFEYKAIDRSGKEKTATVNAENVIMAKQKVKGMGLMLLKIKEKKSGGSGPSNGISLRSSVNVSDLAIMTRQLATLIKAKIPIVEALAALTNQLENPNLKIILGEVRQKVREGSGLGKSLSDYPKVFDTVYINMVEAGEASGTLELVLLRLADFKEAQVRLKNRIRGAMTYPALMAVFGFIMMNIIFIFVIPKIAKIFESMKKELPLATQLCINISNFMVNYWWIVIVGMVVGFVVLRRYIASKGGKRRWHGLQLKMPILGILVKMINVSRFCSTLATLLNSGVDILVALNIVKNLVPNVLMQESIANAREEVKSGNSITGPLVASGHFPPLVTHMISLGEKSGELQDMLKIVSENYEEQVDSRINSLTSTLEPLMMIGLGGAVGFIVVSVIVPMMSLNSVR
jgi:general secretion pathway protein F